MRCDLTYDELAAFSAGDLSEAQADGIRRHVEGCPDCVQRLGELHRTEQALRALPHMEPSATALLRAKRALSETQRQKAEREILTLEDVTQFLRISLDELSEIVEELPAFELGGQIRVRRARLIEWIQQREGQYSRQIAHGRIAQIVPRASVKGVA
jgi:hypothetical protein